MLTQQQRAAQYHGASRSCAELAPWLYPYNDRLIVDKDTGLLAVFEFIGIDTDGAAASLVNAQAAACEFAAKVFSDRPVTHWWRVDRKKTTFYPSAPFPDPVSQSIDDSRRAFFAKGNNRHNRHTLSILMLPDVGQDRFLSRVQRLMMLDEGKSYTRAAIEAIKSFTSDSAAFNYTNDELTQAADRFEELLAAFIGSFPPNLAQFHRLTGDELSTFLSNSFGCINDQETVAMPYSDWFLDSYLPAAEVTPANDFLEISNFGSRFARVITIKTFPQPADGQATGFTSPGQLDKILSVPGDITFSQVFRYKGKSEATKFVNSVRRYTDVARFGWKGILAGAFTGSMQGARENKGRSADLEQISEIEGKLTVDQLVAGWYSATVVCYADSLDELKNLTDAVAALVRGARFVPQLEKQHVLSAWAGTLPGQWSEIVRWHSLDNANLGNLAPLRTISSGKPINEYLTKQLGITCPPLAVFPTDFGTPYYFTHIVMDIGHMLFVGPSRTGKTLLANYLWTAFRKYPGARVIVCDIDYSARIAVCQQGGKYIDFNEGTHKRPNVNPLVLLAEPRHLPFLVQFIKRLCEMRGHEVTATEEQEIEDVLRAMRDGLPKEKWRLLTLYTTINNPKLREQLELWVGDRPYARYFDNVEDDLDLGSLIGIEMRNVLKDEVVSIPFMDLLFYRIQAQMALEHEEARIVPTVIYCPEVFYFLKNEQFAEQVNNYLRTIARYASSLWMDTQSPDELVASGAFSALRDNVKTVIFTPNKKAETASLHETYTREFLLLDSQVQRIANGVAQQDYFIRQEDVSRLIQPTFDRRTVALLSSDRKAQITFDRHFENGRPKKATAVEDYLQDMLGASYKSFEGTNQ